MNYNTIVSSLRTAARDMLRLQKTNTLRDRLLTLNTELNQAKKHYETTVATLSKQNAIADYKLGLVEDSDPEATEKRESLAKAKEGYAKQTEGMEKAMVETQKEMDEAISKVNEAIAKVQSGETLVDMTALTETTQGFIVEIAEEAVRSKLAVLLAEEIKA
jgi:hypothetical protein